MFNRLTTLCNASSSPSNRRHCGSNDQISKCLLNVWALVLQTPRPSRPTLSVAPVRLRPPPSPDWRRPTQCASRKQVRVPGCKVPRSCHAVSQPGAMVPVQYRCILRSQRRSARPCSVAFHQAVHQIVGTQLMRQYLSMHYRKFARIENALQK